MENSAIVWPFSPAPEPSKSVLQRLDDLESTVNALKSGFKGIQNEWEGVYAKMHAARVGLNRKLRDIEKADETAQDDPGTTNEAPAIEPDAMVLRRAFGRR